MIPLRDNIPTKSFPFITWLLIGLNCYVFSLELRLGSPDSLERFIHQWAVIPSALFAHPIPSAYTLVTATFLHGGWMHILSNMLFLHIFGDNVEDRMGHMKYLFFYLLTGAIANGAQAYFMQSQAIPLIGASGAIAGVLGAYFFYYPHSQIKTLIPILFFITIRRIPAFIFLGYWFVLQMFNSAYSITLMASQTSIGGIAFLAHAAGFIAGLLLGPAFGGKTGKYK